MHLFTNKQIISNQAKEEIEKIISFVQLRQPEQEEMLETHIWQCLNQSNYLGDFEKLTSFE